MTSKKPKTTLILALISTIGCGDINEPDPDTNQSADRTNNAQTINCNFNIGNQTFKNEVNLTTINKEFAIAPDEVRNELNFTSISTCHEVETFQNRFTKYEESKKHITLSKYPPQFKKPKYENITVLPPDTNINHIANGSATTHPSVVQVSSDWGRCSGTFIASKTVLTSAHCFPSSGTYTVSIYAMDNGVLRNAATSSSFVYRHPTYTGTGDSGDDLAIIKLDSINSWANTSSRWNRLMVTSPWINAPVEFVGYGRTSHTGGTTSVQLGGNNTVSWVGPVHFTSNADIGARICIGDSGGPAFRVTNTPGDYQLQVGVASEYVDGTAFCPYNTGYMRHTKLTSKINWIESIVGPCNRYNLASNSAIEYARCW